MKETRPLGVDRLARVLVIEDSHAQAVALQRILRAEGFEVELAPDGEKGLDLIRARDFDLVLCDILMPGLSGYDVCRAIKADDRTGQVPVILLTLLTDVADIIKGLESGADNFITKPYDGEYLVGRIRSILAGKEMRDQGEGVEEGETVFRGRRFSIRSSKRRILDYLLSTFEDFGRAKEREHQSNLAQEALHESLRFLQSTLDALSANIAILDAWGSVIAVNSAWRRFPIPNRLVGGAGNIGVNYLSLCDAAAGEGVNGAAEIAEGIRAVGAEDREKFHLEYPWPSPDGERWFHVRVTRFTGGGAAHVVVAHQDITERKRAEEALRESQRTLATLMSNLPGMAYRCANDRRLTMRFVSEGCLDLTGYRPDELVGNQTVAYGDLIHFADRESVNYARQVALRANTPYRLVYRIRVARGEDRWVWEQGRGVLSADGELVAAEGIITDITKRKIAEAAMAEEAQISAALARVGEELIASVNAPTLLDRLSRLATDVLGCDFSQTWLAEEDDDVFVAVSGYGEPAEEWESIQLLKISRDALGEQLGRLQAGEVLRGVAPPEHPLARLAVQSGKTGAMYVGLKRGDNLIGFLAAGYRGRKHVFSQRQQRIVRGIAQLASMVLETARLVEKLELADRFKSDFQAAMSHELRTPLNVIIGYNSLLRDEAFGTLNPEQADTVRRMEKSARELLDLVSATLDLSRFEARRVPVHIEELNVGELIEEVAGEAGPLCAGSDLELRWEVGQELPLLHTDALKLKMVLKNLVGNAIKFTEAGEVAVAARALDGGVEFRVCDTGIGISAEAQKAIFEPFRQADNSIAQRYGGAGLGLSIVWRVLDILGGTITLESELGRGSTFRVWLPWEMPGESKRYVATRQTASGQASAAAAPE